MLARPIFPLRLCRCHVETSADTFSVRLYFCRQIGGGVCLCRHMHLHRQMFCSHCYSCADRICVGIAPKIRRHITCRDRYTFAYRSVLASFYRGVVQCRPGLTLQGSFPLPRCWCKGLRSSWLMLRCLNPRWNTLFTLRPRRWRSSSGSLRPLKVWFAFSAVLFRFDVLFPPCVV